MPRRKSAVEVLPSEESNQPLREVKHKTEWVELRPAEEAEDVEHGLFDDDAVEEKPRRKVNSERDALRQKLAKSNITPGSQLKLTIERYTHSDVVDSQGGMFAETEHCNKYVCAESHITSEDYLDVARKFGSGLYRFTLRMKNQIVTAWDKRISATPSGPSIQNVNPNDPNSPQVIVQGDGQQAVIPSIKDIMKAQKEAFKEQLEMMRLMKEAYGPALDGPALPKSEEEVLMNALMNRSEVVDTLVGSVLRRVGGSSGKDDEPWYADVVRDAVKSGQLVQVVQVAIDRIFNGVSNLFPGRQNQNGQAEVVAAPLQNQAQPVASDQQGQFVHGVQMQLAQDQPAQVGAENAAGPISGGMAGDVHQNGQAQMVSPEEQIQRLITGLALSLDDALGLVEDGIITSANLALTRVVVNCQRKIPPEGTCKWLIAFAEMINDEIPDHTIDHYVLTFAKMTPDQALEFVKTQPNGEAIASLEWAKEYTEQLQKLIRESLQEGDKR